MNAFLFKPAVLSLMRPYHFGRLYGTLRDSRSGNPALKSGAGGVPALRDYLRACIKSERGIIGTPFQGSEGWVTAPQGCALGCIGTAFQAFFIRIPAILNFNYIP